MRLAVHDHTLAALDRLKVDDLDKKKLLERVRPGEGKPKARAAERTVRTREDLYFPKRLSEALDEGGRGSASRLAGFLGVSPDAVTRYRKGDRFPSVPVATKIAHFFGWEVEETIAGLMKDLARRDDTSK